jgi:hypothetical protein
MEVTMKKPSPIGNSVTEEQDLEITEVQESWGFRCKAAFIRAAVKALPPRGELEHRESNGTITPMESRCLNMMKGGRK